MLKNLRRALILGASLSLASNIPAISATITPPASVVVTGADKVQVTLSGNAELGWCVFGRPLLPSPLQGTPLGQFIPSVGTSGNWGFNLLDTTNVAKPDFVKDQGSYDWTGSAASDTTPMVSAVKTRAGVSNDMKLIKCGSQKLAASGITTGELTWLGDKNLDKGTFAFRKNYPQPEGWQGIPDAGWEYSRILFTYTNNTSPLATYNLQTVSRPYQDSPSTPNRYFDSFKFGRDLKGSFYDEVNFSVTSDPYIRVSVDVDESTGTVGRTSKTTQAFPFAAVPADGVADFTGKITISDPSLFDYRVVPTVSKKYLSPDGTVTDPSLVGSRYEGLVDIDPSFVSSHFPTGSNYEEKLASAPKQVTITFSTATGLQKVTLPIKYSKFPYYKEDPLKLSAYPLHINGYDNLVDRFAESADDDSIGYLPSGLNSPLRDKPYISSGVENPVPGVRFHISQPYSYNSKRAVLNPLRSFTIALKPGPDNTEPLDSDHYQINLTNYTLIEKRELPFRGAYCTNQPDKRAYLDDKGALVMDYCDKITVNMLGSYDQAKIIEGSKGLEDILGYLTVKSKQEVNKPIIHLSVLPDVDNSSMDATSILEITEDGRVLKEEPSTDVTLISQYSDTGTVDYIESTGIKGLGSKTDTTYTRDTLTMPANVPTVSYNYQSNSSACGSRTSLDCPTGFLVDPPTNANGNHITPTGKYGILVPPEVVDGTCDTVKVDGKDFCKVESSDSTKKTSVGTPQNFKMVQYAVLDNPDSFYWWSGDQKVPTSDPGSNVQPDTLDLDGDGDTSERVVVYKWLNVNVNYPSQLFTFLQVAGQDGHYGSKLMNASSEASYKLSINNYADTPLSYTSVVGTLPSPQDGRPYNSESIPFWTGQNSEYKVSLRSAPIVQGNLDVTFSTGGSTYVPASSVSDWSKVTSFKVTTPNGQVAARTLNSVIFPVKLEGAGVSTMDADVTIDGSTAKTNSVTIETKTYCVLAHTNVEGWEGLWQVDLVDEAGKILSTRPSGIATASLCTYTPGTYHVKTNVPKNLVATEGSVYDPATGKSPDFELGPGITVDEIDLIAKMPAIDVTVPFGETVEIPRPGLDTIEGEPASWTFRNTCEAQDSFDNTLSGTYFGVKTPSFTLKVTPAPHEAKDCATVTVPSDTVSLEQGASTHIPVDAAGGTVEYTTDPAGLPVSPSSDGTRVDVNPGYGTLPGDYKIIAKITFDDGSTITKEIPVKVDPAPVKDEVTQPMTVSQGDSAERELTLPGNPTLELGPDTPDMFTLEGNKLTAHPTCKDAAGEYPVTVTASYPAPSTYTRTLTIPVTVSKASQADCTDLPTSLPPVADLQQGSTTEVDLPVGDGDVVSTNVPWVTYKDGKLVLAPGADVKPGDYPVTVTVKHPDGSTSTISLPVKVKGSTATVPGDGSPVKVTQGTSTDVPLTLPEGATLLPAGNTPKWVTVAGDKVTVAPTCATTPGESEVPVVALYADGRRETVMIPVDVQATDLAVCDNSATVPGNLVLTPGKRTQVDLHLPAGASVSLPEGTPDWVTVEDGKLVFNPPAKINPGDYEFTPVVTYADGSTKKLPVKAYVEEPAKDPAAPSVTLENQGSSPWNWLWVIPAVLGLMVFGSYWQYINQVDGGDRYPLTKGDANPADWIRWIQGLPARESGGLR